MVSKCLGAKNGRKLLGMTQYIKTILLFYSLIISEKTILIDAQFPDYAFNNHVIEKSASCDRNFIYFSILFAKPFLGLIYTDGTFGSQRCMYVNGSSFSQIRYNITIPLNECRSQTFPNGSSQNVVVVQRDWRILEASDHLFVITCNINPNSASGFNSASGGKFTLSFAGVTVQGSLGSTEIVTSSFSDIDYTADVTFGAGPSGRKLDRPLGVGESISYVVRLRKLRAGRVDARIGRCWATDGTSSAPNSQNTEIQLSDDEGCTVLPGSNIWNNFRSDQDGEDGRILYNEIKAWAFPTSNRVNIFCNLHLCPSTCPSSTCRLRDEKSTPLPPLSIFTPHTKNITDRPKRDTRDESTDQEDEQMITRISTGYEVFPERRPRDDSFYQRDSLLVTSDVAGFRRDDGASQPKTVCLTYTNFIIGISLLLIIIILSFIFILTLLCKMFGPAQMKRKLSGDRIRRFLSNGGQFSFRSDAMTTDSESAVTNSNKR